MSSSNLPTLRCQKSGVFLEITGLNDDFEVLFNSLRRKYSGLNTADDDQETRYQVCSRWSNEEQAYVKVRVPIADPHKTAAKEERMGLDDDDSFGGDVGNSAMARVSRLIAFSVESTGLDHPMSASCFRKELEKTKKSLDAAQKEQEAYQDLNQRLEAINNSVRAEGVTRADGATSARENFMRVGQTKLYGEETVLFNDRSLSTEQLLEQVEQLKHELKKCESERQQVKQRLRNERRKHVLYRGLRRRCWSELQSMQMQLQTFRQEGESLKTRADTTGRELQHLNSCSACNDAFHIWHRGAFATINGFRLGRLPTEQVSWAEINAGLGQAAMLLTTIASHAKLRFTNYRILPLGSFSKIVRATDERSVYQLFFDGSFLRRRSFNNALTGFLSCVQEAGAYAQQQDPTVQLPYHIYNNKIGDLTVCYGTDDKWTRALKFLLTHLKWLLVWTAKNHAD